MKALYIAEKPSVAQEFAKALKINATRKNGYLESQDAIVTWCVGHLVSMSYPEKYDENLKKWELNTLPFLPETPIQLLVEGLLYDFGQLTLPFDNVDEEYLKKPRRFDIKSLKHFMLIMGPLSSAFDLLVFAFLWFVFKIREVAIFQTVWFTYSIVSNLLGMHIIRTAKIPFVQSNAHKFVYFSSILLSIKLEHLE